MLIYLKGTGSLWTFKHYLYLASQQQIVKYHITIPSAIVKNLEIKWCRRYSTIHYIFLNLLIKAWVMSPFHCTLNYACIPLSENLQAIFSILEAVLNDRNIKEKSKIFINILKWLMNHDWTSTQALYMEIKSGTSTETRMC